MMLTVAPAVAVVIPVAAGAVDTPPVIETEETVLSVEGAIVSVTLATTPFDTWVELRPQITHRELPAALVQVRVLLAPVAAAPAMTLTPEKSAAGYPRVHCTPAGWLPVVEVSETFIVTLLPGLPEPGAKLSVTCPRLGSNAASPRPRSR